MATEREITEREARMRQLDEDDLFLLAESGTELEVTSDQLEANLDAAAAQRELERRGIE